MRCINIAGNRPTYKAISMERGEMQCSDDGRHTAIRRGVQEKMIGERRGEEKNVGKSSRAN